MNKVLPPTRVGKYDQSVTSHSGEYSVARDCYILLWRVSLTKKSLLLAQYSCKYHQRQRKTIYIKQDGSNVKMSE